MIRKETGRYISFDGTPIYFEMRGRGRPIFMVYGIGCLMNHWQHQVKYFSQSSQVILMDYRGHQNTPRPHNMGFVSIEALARDVIGLAEYLGFNKADFWGHSFGAQVLLKTYALKSDLFNSLVLINGFASDPLTHLYGVGFFSQLLATFRAWHDSYPNFVNSAWRTMLTNPLFIPLSAFSGGFNLHLSQIRDIEIYAKGVSTQDISVFITLFEDMLRFDGRPILPDIRIPTLIIGGEKDRITPPELQQELHQSIPHSELQIVPYGSHCTQLDFPDFVNLRAEKFLRQT